MSNINFGKPLHDLPEEELIRLINNSQPEFGMLAQYELSRRLSVEDSKTSKRYAIWSLILSVTAILISIAIGIVQIYLSIK